MSDEMRKRRRGNLYYRLTRPFRASTLSLPSPKDDNMDFMIGEGDDDDMRAIWAGVVRVEEWEKSNRKPGAPSPKVAVRTRVFGSTIKARGKSGQKVKRRSTTIH